MTSVNQPQLTALNQAIARARQAPFYHDRLPAEELTDLHQLKTLPLVTKDDLRQQSPWGLLATDRRQLRQYHESFGTTGTPVSTWLTSADLADNAWQVNQCGIDFRPGDRVLIRYPYALSLIAHMIHRAAQQKGATVIAASSRNTITPFARVIQLMQKLDITVLAALPMQAILLAETAAMLGKDSRSDFPALRAIEVGGELLTPRKRRWIEDLWQVPVIELYGMTEAGTCLADCGNGRLHLIEDHFIIELLDDNWQTEVPDGQIGNLVITTITEKATPLIRFRTDDRARKILSPCACGRGAAYELRGRRHDLITIAGQELDLWDLDELVGTLPGHHLWVAGPSGPPSKGLSGNILHLVIEETVDPLPPDWTAQLQARVPFPLQLTAVPYGTLYNRQNLLSTAEVGKPRYLFTAEEMDEQAYRSCTRL
ncbi:phenylacetate--CoA ligase family protein [Heliophilum fasciatum]|uniref:Phenylacetate-CoA ligase n=1 Tax=Heliophilum fasciatum TaxID=35700 RepID=A0A4R2S0C4_9FIRM|nr:AMP-binding protein [Heliophilum fasciatum]MCW2276750.1 phenylacetate-CoA ligase [Heliophilum fasciatum]TCP68869.1 phenylacetate-CoA ligase [Heliophilum fasciatum]